MDIALFVAYLLTMVAIVLGVGWGIQFYRDLQHRLHESDAGLRATQAELRALQGPVNHGLSLKRELDSVDSTQQRLSVRLDRLEGRFDSMADDQSRQLAARTATQSRTESRVAGLLDAVAELRRRDDSTSDRVARLEREAIPRLDRDLASLARSAWELGVAQASGTVPVRGWLRGHLRLSDDADGEAIFDLYLRAAEAIGLDVVYVSEPNLADGGRTIGLRVAAAGAGAGTEDGGLAGVAATLERRLDVVDSATAPAADDALAKLLTAVAAVGEGSVLLATVWCVSGSDGTRCYLIGLDDLVRIVGTDLLATNASAFERRMSADGHGRQVAVGPWLRAQRDAARERSLRETALAQLADELRAQVVDELRLRIEQEEGPRIERELREELRPLVRREEERRWRRRPGDRESDGKDQTRPDPT